MADAETARLCGQIIHVHFGPLTSAVVSELLTRGRLTLPQLVRFTSLKPKTVRQAILVLIQHNVLWHDRTEDEGEVFEVNTGECLTRLRFGRHVWQAEQLFGQAGAEILQIVLDHGKLRPPDILSHLSSNASNRKEYSQVLHDMVASYYLKPSTVLSQVCPRDILIKYTNEEKAKIAGFPTAKELRQAREAAEARFKQEEEDAEHMGLKRNTKESTNATRSNKRKSIAEEDTIDNNTFFRVNFDKFNIHIRNQLIETAVRERFNDTTALVMQATLKSTEPKQKNLSDTRSDPTSIANILTRLPEEIDLGRGLVQTSLKSPSDVSLVKDYLGLLSFADCPTQAGRASSYISMTGSKVTVEFETVCGRLRRRALEAVARERHGDEGVRIIRLLLDIGKMDEKQISKVAMMSLKEVRPLLAAMSSGSLVSIQEVPKSADRDPKRTFYLWYVDLPKAYSVLLVSFYKTLYNIGSRRKSEAEEPTLKAVLEKRERTDVIQDESLLTRMEREMLTDWEKRQEKLTALELRVEEGVFLLRDLAVLGINEE